MTYISFTMKLVSIALAFLFNLERFAVEAKMEIDFPAGTLIAGSTDEYKVQLRMQGATPTAARLTQCTGFVLTTQRTTPIYAVQFTGHAPSNIVHHLVLYGCSSRPTGDPCSCPLRQRYTLFVSTLNTPPIRFKTIEGFNGGMQIGGTQNLQYVFLEIHYVSASTIPDTSTGVDVQYVLTAPSRYVGIYSIFAPGSIAPGQPQATVDGCAKVRISSRIVGYQVHAHSHGRIVSLYHRSSTGTVTLVGNWNPQFPQAFFQRSGLDVVNAIGTGQTFGIRCVFNSVNEAQTIYTLGVSGQSGTEMCFVNLLVIQKTGFLANLFEKATTTCATNFIQPNSLTPFPANTILSNHALYGNQTGTVVVDSSHTVQLDLLTFT